MLDVTSILRIFRNVVKLLSKETMLVKLMRSSRKDSRWVPSLINHGRSVRLPGLKCFYQRPELLVPIPSCWCYCLMTYESWVFVWMGARVNCGVSNQPVFLGIAYRDALTHRLDATMLGTSLVLQGFCRHIEAHVQSNGQPCVTLDFDGLL